MELSLKRRTLKGGEERCERYSIVVDHCCSEWKFVGDTSNVLAYPAPREAMARNSREGISAR